MVGRKRKFWGIGNLAESILQIGGNVSKLEGTKSAYRWYNEAEIEGLRSVRLGLSLAGGNRRQQNAWRVGHPKLPSRESHVNNLEASSVRTLPQEVKGMEFGVRAPYLRTSGASC
jgi:hypothetical protein